YEPATCSFLSPDPLIADEGNWLNYNRYLYCLGNPVKFADPTGMQVLNPIYDVEGIYKYLPLPINVPEPSFDYIVRDKNFQKWRRDYSRLHLSIVFRFCLSSIQISHGSVDLIPQHKVEILHFTKSRQSTVFFDTVERGESRHNFIGADHFCDVCLLLIINKEDVGIPVGKLIPVVLNPTLVAEVVAVSFCNLLQTVVVAVLVESLCGDRSKSAKQSKYQ
ncbi:MAG: hypothetical protein KIH03_00695, partial [Paludibacteraceae bacterium]|nr:hypothetical protein [Paludibacteraceae bacterium]